MAKSKAGGTMADDVCAAVRANILAGRLRPGERLKFQDFCTQFGVSAGIVREALTRLLGQGLVTGEAHQGFQVVTLSHYDLQQLTAARVELEPLVFQLAVREGSMQWEANAVAAHHLLARSPLVEPNDPARLGDAWSTAHANFHATLLAGSGNRRLLAISLRLREEAELYRRWSVSLGSEPERDLASEHQALLEAAVAREAPRACELLREHIARTARQLVTCAVDDYSGMPEPQLSPAATWRNPKDSNVP